MSNKENYIPEEAYPDVKFPIEVHWNPSIVTYPSGKTYATSGDTIVRVPAGTTLADLPRWVKWTPQESKTEKKIVEGSKGSKYTVTFNSEKETYACTCPAYKFRGKCKHISIAFPS